MEDDVRRTRIGRCYSRLWNNGHVKGALFLLAFPVVLSVFFSCRTHRPLVFRAMRSSRTGVWGREPPLVARIWVRSG
jgi:hypothetical protein